MTIASPITLALIHSRSQLRLKFDYFLTCNISDNTKAITFKFGMPVDVWMPYMLVLVLMTLTLIQRHSGSGKAKSQRCMLSATKQARSIKLATTLWHLLYNLAIANVYMA